MDPQLAVQVAAKDDGLLAHVTGDEIAQQRYLAFMTKIEPAAPE
jgi:hypothetical protein